MVWKALGLGCARVPHVILTHLHTIHQNLEDFPAATFVVQKRAFWTGRFAGEQFRTLIEPNDVLYLVRENIRGRLCLVAGTREVVPGSKSTEPADARPGLQVVRAKTGRGSVVLASDTTLLHEHRRRSPLQPSCPTWHRCAVPSTSFVP